MCWKPLSPAGYLRRPGPGENESCPITAWGSDSRVSEEEGGKKRKRRVSEQAGGSEEGGNEAG